MWEVVEALRKASIGGLFVFFDPGSLTQLVLGMMVAFLFILLYFQIQPYDRQSNNLLQEACQVVIFLTLLGAFVMRLNSTASDKERESSSFLPDTTIGYVLIGMTLVSVLSAIALMKGEIRGNQSGSGESLQSKGLARWRKAKRAALARVVRPTNRCFPESFFAEALSPRNDSEMHAIGAGASPARLVMQSKAKRLITRRLTRCSATSALAEASSKLSSERPRTKHESEPLPIRDQIPASGNSPSPIQSSRTQSERSMHLSEHLLAPVEGMQSQAANLGEVSAILPVQIGSAHADGPSAVAVETEPQPPEQTGLIESVVEFSSRLSRRVSTTLLQTFEAPFASATVSEEAESAAEQAEMAVLDAETAASDAEPVAFNRLNVGLAEDFEARASTPVAVAQPSERAQSPSARALSSHRGLASHRSISSRLAEARASRSAMVAQPNARVQASTARGRSSHRSRGVSTTSSREGILSSRSNPRSCVRLGGPMASSLEIDVPSPDDEPAPLSQASSSRPPSARSSRPPSARARPAPASAALSALQESRESRASVSV